MGLRNCALITMFAWGLGGSGAVTADEDVAQSPTEVAWVPPPAAGGRGLDDETLGVPLGLKHVPPPRHLAPDQLAQFQLPPSSPDGKPAATLLPDRLVYQFGYASETTSIYRRNRDLDSRNRDNSHVLAPNINGIITYRPTNWLDTTLELIAEKEVPVHEERTVLLPNGTTQVAPRRRVSILVDQAFFTIRNITAPFEFTVGRRNYEDDRRWIYDTSMDIIGATFRSGRLRMEVLGGREIYRSLELAPRIRETPDRINTYIYYADYRGFEDHKLAVYSVFRNDLKQIDAKPRLYGLRAQGSPFTNLTYWAELAFLRGQDEKARPFSGRGFDTGFTYRFTGVAFYPNFTLGYAFGTGDGNPNAKKNYEFRQTGIHSNEWRFGGIPQFKVYGEALDPDLSNLGIFTAAIGFYPAARVSVDLVYHYYRLDKIADEIRGSQITAQMAQVDTHLSRKVGSALDLVIGFRNLFGIRRLGLDLRAGLFFPGLAYLRNEGTDDKPQLHHAQRGAAIITKLWW